MHATQALRTLLLDELNAFAGAWWSMHMTDSPLTIEEIQAWQREATRHQEERLVEIESDEGTLTRMRVSMAPGRFKQHENLIVSGHTEYEFCPPDRVQPELERVLVLDEGHRAGPAPTATCAAWMHAAFNAVHPFPDGNGRTGRLLTAWVYLRRNEHPSADHDRRSGASTSRRCARRTGAIRSRCAP